MIRPWHTWVIFSLCLAVVLAAMGWISLTVLRLDRNEALAARRAVLEENARLALWRMDSALAPLIAQESARPYFAYSAFYPTQRAYNRMFAEIQRGEVLLPSPLLDQASPYILVHFQIEPDGSLTSPQVPTGNMRDLAETGYRTADKIEASARLLAELQSLIDRDALLAALSPPETPPLQVAVVTQDVPMQGPASQPAAQQWSAQPAARQVDQAGQAADLQQRTKRQAEQVVILQSDRAQFPAAQQQTLSNTLEWQARNSNVDDNASILVNKGSNVRLMPVNVNEGVARPMWAGDVLLLARWVVVGGQTYLQGCRFDWPAIQTWLIDEVKDLLPQADLQPVREPANGHNEGRMLAALPVKLIPGSVPFQPARSISPIRISLVVAWICVLLAASAVVSLLIGTVSLSERRGAFVSAVTHEMRTPLTTFRMYTEMLTKGMIPDEAKRRRYLETLRGEADRLSHLIENVLAYARLERNRAGGRIETVALSDLVDRVKDRLNERAVRAGMTLAVETDGSASTVNVRADTSAVEQILFNLVDNACKYAAAASDRRIHLEAGLAGKLAELRVRDHGPGIAKPDGRRLFRPFCKSARDAANSAPGVGLGLALSRRLARQMSGNLSLCPHTSDGTCFVLSLPRTAA